MFEKVNPSHPDKIADRIAGAIVDYAYSLSANPKIAVEALVGHQVAHVIIETDASLEKGEICKIIYRISGITNSSVVICPQDKRLADNQAEALRCGDNGIFKGMPMTEEQQALAKIAHDIYEEYPTDGKYIINNKDLIICQSNAKKEDLLAKYPGSTINPLGEWSGGTDVDTGAVNRKLGSDMGDSVTGGGLHGKDLSKADVSANIYAFLKAQRTGKPVELYCAIGDDKIDNKPYSEIVEEARDYINLIGGFEKFAEWGLISY